jgi:RimJ/RimL family protein N-acetyltransferase
MKGFYYIVKGNDIMGALRVTLKQEVTRNDALLIMNWMENLEVTRYLNETANISTEIYNTINRVNLAVLTHLFNRDCSFYLIHDDSNRPIGFLKLVHRANEAEMVVVIGDKNKWGQGLGAESINQGLNQAFFQWRVPRVIAKISPSNTRSVRAFEKAGFQYDNDLAHSKLYSITLQDYINRIVRV